MPAQSDNTLVLVNGFTRLIGSSDTIEFTAGMDNTPIGANGASTLAATSGAFTTNVGIGGDLTVQGSIVSSGTLDAIVKDQFIDLIHGNADATNAKSGGFTANLYPSAATGCGGAAGLATASFTAGATGVSDAIVTLGGAATQTGAGIGGVANMLTLAVNPTVGDTVTIENKRGVADTVLLAGPGGTPTDFAIGVDAAATALNLATVINNLANFASTHGGAGPGAQTFSVTAAVDNIGSLMNGRSLSFAGGTIDITSGTTLLMAGGAGLGVGDIIEVANADDEDNNGLFQVKAIAGADITITGELTASSTQAPFCQSQFTTNATDTNGLVRGVNIAAMAFGNAILVDGAGAALAVGTLCSSYTGLNSGAAGTSYPANVADIFYTPAAESTLQGAYDAGTGDITLANGKDLDVIAFTSTGASQGAAINLAANHSSAWIVGDSNNTSADLTLRATQIDSQVYLDNLTGSGQNVDQDGAATIGTNAVQVTAVDGGVAVAGNAVLLQAGGSGITDRLVVESLNADVSMWSGLASGNGNGIRVIASDSGMYLEQGAGTTTEGFAFLGYSEASKKNGDVKDGFAIAAEGAGGSLVWGRGLHIEEKGQHALNQIAFADFSKMVVGDEIAIQGIIYTFGAAQNLFTRTFFGTDEATCATSLTACITSSVGAPLFGAQDLGLAQPGYPATSAVVHLTAVDPGTGGNALTLAITVDDAAAYSGPGGGAIQATFLGGAGFTTELAASSGNLAISSGSAVTVIGNKGAELRADGGSGVLLQGYASAGPSIAINGLGASAAEAVFKVTGVGAVGDTVTLGGVGEWFTSAFVAVAGAAGPGEWTVGGTVVETTNNLAAAIGAALAINNDLGGTGVVVTVYGGHFISIKAGTGDAAITTATTGTTGAWEGAGWVAGSNSGLDIVGRGDTNLMSWTHSASNYAITVAAMNFGSGKANLTMSAGDAISLTATGSTLALVCGTDGSFEADGALLLEALGGDLQIKTSGAYLTQEGAFSTSGSAGLDRGWCFVMSGTDDEVISADAANMAGLPPLGVANTTTAPSTSCKATMLQGACVDFQIAEAYALGWVFLEDVDPATGFQNGDKFTINSIDFIAAAAEDLDAQEFKLDPANVVTTAQSLMDCINAAKTAAANINVRARIDGSGNNDGKVYLQVLTAQVNNYPLAATIVKPAGGSVSDATIGAGGTAGTQVGTIPGPGTLLYLSSTAQGIYSGNGQATDTCPSASGDSVIRVGVITNDSPKPDSTTPPQHPDVFSCRWMPQFIANRP